MFNVLFNSFFITFNTMKRLYKSCVVFTCKWLSNWNKNEIWASRNTNNLQWYKFPWISIQLAPICKIRTCLCTSYRNWWCTSEISVWTKARNARLRIAIVLVVPFKQENFNNEFIGSVFAQIKKKILLERSSKSQTCSAFWLQFFRKFVMHKEKKEQNQLWNTFLQSLIGLRFANLHSLHSHM